MPAVLDASAVLAIYFDEPDSEIVRPALMGAQVSAVNYSEVISKALDRGDTLQIARTKLSRLGFLVVPHDLDLAIRAAALRPLTKRLGLSAGDRACLALAEREKLPVFTVDRTWVRLKLAFEIIVLR